MSLAKCIYLLSLILFVSNSFDFSEGRRLLYSPEIPPTESPIINIIQLDQDSLPLSPINIHQISSVLSDDDGYEVLAPAPNNIHGDDAVLAPVN